MEPTLKNWDPGPERVGSTSTSQSRNEGLAQRYIDALHELSDIERQLEEVTEENKSLKAGQVTFTAGSQPDTRTHRKPDKAAQFASDASNDMIPPSGTAKASTAGAATEGNPPEGHTNLVDTAGYEQQYMGEPPLHHIARHGIP